MSEALKPCPWCGGPATLFASSDHSTAYEGGCGNMDCPVEPQVWKLTEAEAIAAWNRRAPEASGDADVARLADELERSIDPLFPHFPASERARDSAAILRRLAAENAALRAASAPVSYHRDDEGSEAAESYAKLMAQLDDKGRRTLANLVAHGAKAVLAPDGAVVLTRSDWAELRILRAASAPAVPQGDIGMVCPSAPERIWLQVDPEPEEEGKPVAPADPHQDDVTWCVDKINASDTLYIRADLAASPQVAAPAPQSSLIADAARVIEWARSKPRKPAQSAFTDGPERQAAYWIEWAESAAPQPDVEKEREAFLAWVNDCGCDTDGAWSAWIARASLGGKHD